MFALHQADPSLALTHPIPLTVHPAAVYLRSLGEGSRSTMGQSLNAIASLLTDGACDALTLDWSKLRYRHTSAVQAALLERYQPATAKKVMCAIRRVLKEARKLELIDERSYAAAIELPSIKERQKLRGRALSAQEIGLLLAACQKDLTAAGVRDAALIGILRGAGLRRAEVVKLEVRDFHLDTSALDVRCGKGGKDRNVYLPSDVVSLLQRWLLVRGQSEGALLCPIRKGGEIQHRHMTPQAVMFVLQKRAREAGVESFSPHDFRRTFCSDLLDAGVDIVTVQKLAGHASPLTTAKYDRRGEEVKRRAVEQLRLT